MIIDRTKPEMKHLPDSMDGDVLLEEVKDASGRLIGYSTAPIEAVEKWKHATPAERQAAGWDRHQQVLDNLPDEAIAAHKATMIARRGPIDREDPSGAVELERARIRDEYRKSPPATDAERIRALEIIMGLREPEIGQRERIPEK